MGAGCSSAPSPVGGVRTRKIFTSTPRGSLHEYAERFSSRVLREKQDQLDIYKMLHDVYGKYHLKGGALLSVWIQRRSRFQDQLYADLAHGRHLRDIDVFVGTYRKDYFVSKLLTLADDVERSLGSKIQKSSQAVNVMNGVDYLFGRVYKESIRKTVSCYAVDFTKCTEVPGRSMLLGRIGVSVCTKTECAVHLAFIDVCAFEIEPFALKNEFDDDDVYTPYTHMMDRDSVLHHLCDASKRMLGVDCNWRFNDFSSTKLVRRVDRCVYASLLLEPHDHAEKIRKMLIACLNLSAANPGESTLSSIPFKAIRAIVTSAYWNCETMEDFQTLVGLFSDAFLLAFEKCQAAFLK